MSVPTYHCACGREYDRTTLTQQRFCACGRRLLPTALPRTTPLPAPPPLLPPPPWLDSFRQAVDTYYQQPHDPFMTWFRTTRRNGGFTSPAHQVFTILVAARFDQATDADTALRNTQRVYTHAWPPDINPSAMPELEGTSRRSAAAWRFDLLQALPALRSTADYLQRRRNWEAPHLLAVLHGIPNLGERPARTALRWLHELLPDLLTIDMRNAPLHVDVGVYRVATRLGLVDPQTEPYTGPGCLAEQKLQAFARHAFPAYPLRVGEPLWHVGRDAAHGGWCYPQQPACPTCLFTTFCPKRARDQDPARLGYLAG